MLNTAKPMTSLMSLGVIPEVIHWELRDVSPYLQTTTQTLRRMSISHSLVTNAKSATKILMKDSH